MTHLSEPELNLLIDDVLADLANPQPGTGFLERMTTPVADGSRQSKQNILVFGTLQPNGRPVSRAALSVAALLNVAAALLLFLHVHGDLRPAVTHPVAISLIEPPPPPAKLPPKTVAMGGGGGQKGPTPVTRGNPPKFAPTQLNPPKAPPLEQPKISVPVTVDVQQNIRMAKSDVPQFGMPNSPLVGMSMGNGNGSGLGSGNGVGIGPGGGGGMGGGLRRIGGGVSAPVVLFAPEPEFSEEARKAKVAGNVLVYLQVDAAGRPTHVRVLRGIGLGLDQKALEAVRLYRFKPAIEGGHPVAVEMNVEVSFQIF